MLLLLLLLRASSSASAVPTVRQGEGLRLSPVRPTGVEEQRSVLVILVQQAGVLESRDHALLALDARKRHCAHFL